MERLHPGVVRKPCAPSGRAPISISGLPIETGKMRQCGKFHSRLQCYASLSITYRLGRHPI